MKNSPVNFITFFHFCSLERNKPSLLFVSLTQLPELRSAKERRFGALSHSDNI
jgi:hypothetical protein